MNNTPPELNDWIEIHKKADNAVGGDIPGGAFTRAFEKVTYGIANAGLKIEQLMKSVSSIKKSLDGLNASIQAFSGSTTELTVKAQKLVRWEIALTAIIAATSLLSLWNIYLTNEMKDEATRANQIAAQPFLDLIGDDGTPVRYANKGMGPALNIFLLRWDNIHKKLYLTSERNVGGALAVDKEGGFDVQQMNEVEFSEVQKKVPYGVERIKHLQDEEINFISVFYEDLFGNRFATFNLGAGGEYNKAVEFISFQEL